MSSSADSAIGNVDLQAKKGEREPLAKRPKLARSQTPDGSMGDDVQTVVRDTAPLQTVASTPDKSVTALEESRRRKNAADRKAAPRVSSVSGGAQRSLPKDRNVAARARRRLGAVAEVTPDAAALPAEGKLVPSSAPCVPVKAKVPSKAALHKALGTVRNVQELKERLAKFDARAARLISNSGANAEPKDEPIVEAVASSSTTPVKPLAEDERLPAHQRLDSFLQSGRADLPLPPSYALLSEMFRGCETAVSLLHNRDELPTFDKVKATVEQLTKRTFKRSHLGRIKTVYPEAYGYRLHDTALKFGSRSGVAKCELIVEPNLSSDLIGYKLPTPKKTPQKGNEHVVVKLPAVSLPGRSPSRRARRSPRKKSRTPSPSRDVGSRLTGSRQVYRREIFKRNITDITKGHHRAFLNGLSPPVVLSASDELMLARWHPEFRLDAIAEIAESPLPSVAGPAKAFTAKELVSRCGAHDALPSKVKAKLFADEAENVAVSAEPLKAEALSLPANETKAPLTSVGGVPLTLLQRVRAKDAARKASEMRESPADVERRSRLSRLPNFVRIIRTYCKMEQRTSLPLADVVRRLRESDGASFGAGDVEVGRHLSLLCEVLPDWISRTSVAGKGDYVRVELASDQAALLARLDKLITK